MRPGPAALLALGAVLYTPAAATPLTPHKHVLFVVGDDVGYGYFGHFNDQKTVTPTVDGPHSPRGLLHLQDLLPVAGRHADGPLPVGGWLLRRGSRHGDTDHCTTN